jgi:hypothetical protein
MPALERFVHRDYTTNLFHLTLGYIGIIVVSGFPVPTTTTSAVISPVSRDDDMCAPTSWRAARSDKDLVGASLPCVTIDHLFIYLLHAM